MPIFYLTGFLSKILAKVLHLRHLLSFDLNERDDIIRTTKDVNRKANYDLYFTVLGAFCNDLSLQNVLSIALWLYFMASSKMSASFDE